MFFFDRGSKMASNTDEIVHLNDFSFVQLCNKEYGVNRGVYNTIDSWFYKNGIVDILQRRKIIIFFLESLNETKELQKKRSKFGRGGLTLKLQEYFSALHIK